MSVRIRVRSLVVACACVLSAASRSPADPPPPASPWGVAASASSMRDRAQWFPKVAAAGVTSVRLFPEWRSVERKPGEWNWDAADALVKDAADNHLEVNAILMGAAPGTKSGAHAFPMAHLDDWSAFVATAVDRYKGRIRYWEVWNEGNGAFNDEHHTAADYARLAAATYAAAKHADPDAKVGLTVASYDAAYLEVAIRAMAEQNTPDAFDFLCVHPYEIADGLTDPDGEIPFLWMTRGLRDMLRRAAPARQEAEIWITEVGRRVGRHGNRTTTDADAAKSLVKLYTMALAQGIRRTQWFEGQDPTGEDQGFGLLARDGHPRAAYTALQAMTSRLGPAPTYLGWLALGAQQRGYGFVFQGAAGPVLVAWMPAGLAQKDPTFAQDVTLVDPVAGTSSLLKSASPVTLIDSPVFILDLPPDLIDQAKRNVARPFPWGGDHAAATAVTAVPATPDASTGVFQTARDATPHCTFPDGSTGIILRGDQGVQFYVHPSFATLDTREYYVRATVRRLAPGNLGMNLHYAVADSHARAPYKNVGEWFAVSKEDGWQTHTWHLTDACLAKMWGYDLAIRPEQSVPFVLGKLEVSKTPFR